MMYKSYFIRSICWLLLVSCNQSTQEAVHSNDGSSVVSAVPINYAELFTIQVLESYTLVAVKNPWQPAEHYAQYTLVPKEQALPNDLPKDSRLIRTPIKNIVTMSSPQIGVLDLLGLEDKIVGHSKFSYIANDKVNARINKGEVMEVGELPNLNIEGLIELHPDMMMKSGFEKIHDKLQLVERSGIPVAYNLGYMENSPLGRAEWIKFVAVFFDRLDVADSVFKSIENNYLAAREKAKQVSKKPSVMLSCKWKGVWYMAGGNSYMANFLKDAGADYYWFSDTTRGGMPLSFEEVLDKQMDSDIWLNPSAATTIAEILSQDERYRKFAPIQNGTVYNNINKVSESGANDYWESGIVNPHLILYDLIKILHPDLLPDHQLIYYKQLPQQ